MLQNQGTASTRRTAATEGGRSRHTAIAAALAILMLAATATAKDNTGLDLQAGVASFEETGGLHLDMAFTKVAIAPMWVSAPIDNPDQKGVAGKGMMHFHTSSGTLKVSADDTMSAYDLAAAINEKKGPVRAALVNNGNTYHLLVAAESGNSPAAFEDTGTIHLPSGIDAFEDTGTIHIEGGHAAASFGQSLSSAPVDSASKPGRAGAGTLWLTMGSDTLAVDVSESMSLADVRDAINGESEAFTARIEHSKAGYTLVIDAASPEVLDLLAFEDTGTIHLPGGMIAFEDTGTIHIDGGFFTFEDTGTIHVPGGAIAFEDTGTIHLPGGFFTFEDTGTIHMPGALFSFEDTGTIHITLDGKLKS